MPITAYLYSSPKFLSLRVEEYYMGEPLIFRTTHIADLSFKVSENSFKGTTVVDFSIRKNRKKDRC